MDPHETTTPGGIVHTYQKYDPVNFPSPTAPPPDLVSPLFDHLLTYGDTDEFGAQAVENKVHVHDLHATILHLLGIDHTKLTYHYSGRDFRLTDVAGNVIHDLIA